MNSPAKMDVSHMDLFYGDYQALTDINISFANRYDRPFRVRQINAS